jgi:hypothetical protein
MAQHMKSDHQKNVEKFISNMGMLIPWRPQTELSDEKRLLLAKLLLKETLETIQRGLRVNLFHIDQDKRITLIDFDCIDFGVDASFDILETIDGVCDVRFVATKLLSLCGVPDIPFQNEVDMNNLTKFAGGAKVEKGKLQKPKDHKPPRIKELFESLTFE